MKRWIVIALGLAAALAVAGVVAFLFARDHEGNFSNYPGFDEYFAANPPSRDPPGPAEQALLAKFAPRFYLPPGHEGLAGFYQDYIANGTLRAGDGRVISDKVTQAELNRWKDDPGVEFVHAFDKVKKLNPTVPARIDEVRLALPGGEERFRVLTYTAVFRRSGLLAGLGWWQSLIIAMLGDLDDWHQLDNYTAVSIVIDNNETPVAVMLQHHNYRHTYVVGEAVRLPPDGRIEIDVAIRSNELYLHKSGRQRRRAVSFLSPRAWRYMVGSLPRLTLTADDITEPVREADYRLSFLAPADAFYTFKGYLGERRWLMGRSGPPGADYRVLPQHLPLDIQLAMGYWRYGNAGDQQRLERALSGDTDNGLAFARLQMPVLGANIVCARRWKRLCAFR